MASVEKKSMQAPDDVRTFEKGRVEITNCEGHSCVMISKEELDLIESALEILSNLHEVQVLHEKVKHVLTLDDQTQPVPEVRLAAAEQRLCVVLLVHPAEPAYERCELHKNS